MSRPTLAASLALSVVLVPSAFAQAGPASQPAPAPGAIAAHADWPKANPDDVKSPEAIIAAFSAGISGEAGAPRDWTRVQSLFLPAYGRVAPIRVPKDAPVDVTVMTAEEYKARGSSSTFYERPIAFQKQTFGHMTHVYESYGIYRAATDKEPSTRGVNSWELLFDGTRYWIVEAFWDSERLDNPIPVNLLK